MMFVHRFGIVLFRIEHTFDNCCVVVIETAAAFEAAAAVREGVAGSVVARRLEAAVEALRLVPTEVSEYRSVGEDVLLLLNRLNAEAARLTHTHGALIAGQIARRSAPEFGSQGLAQRFGHRTPEQFITMTTGTSRRQAVNSVRAGVLLGEAADEGSLNRDTGEVCTPSQPWLRPLSQALHAGDLSVEAGEAIRAGVGAPNSAVSPDQLLGLVSELVAVARVRPDGSAGMDVDHLLKLARVRREELDLDAVRVREDEQHAARSLKLVELPTGMGRLLWDMPPETFVLVKQVFERAVSPKLKKVRFTDPATPATADTILADDRTPAQVAADAFEQVLLVGAGANPDCLLGSGAPQIRVTTTLKALQSGDGIVRVEGYSGLLSMRSLKRLTCTGEVQLLLFDENLLPLDLGRTQRLFTQPQRTALAVKWGGCAAPGCDAPVSWTESHHCDEWLKHGGNTNVADAVPFCRYHHLLVHNNDWRVNRDPEGNYWLIPPNDHDHDQVPRLLTPKTRNMADLQRELDNLDEHEHAHEHEHEHEHQHQHQHQHQHEHEHASGPGHEHEHEHASGPEHQHEHEHASGPGPGPEHQRGHEHGHGHGTGPGTMTAAISPGQNHREAPQVVLQHEQLRGTTCPATGDVR